MIRALALVSGAVCIFTTLGAVTALAQEKKIKQVGAWTIVSISDRGAFHRCAAETRSGSGLLRVANIVNGAWSISFPGFGGRVRQIPGAVRLNGLDAPRVVVTDGGQRASTGFAPRWVDEVRRGNGRLMVAAAGRNYAWDMRDGGAALGAVHDCVALNRRFAAPVMPPRIAGFANVRPQGYAPPPPQIIVVQTPAPAQQPRLAAAPVAPMADPLATLKYIYANIDKPRTDPFSRRLAALRDAAMKRGQEISEPVAGTDFDYAVNGQDAEANLVKTLKYQILGQDARRASIKASFQNGNPVELRYDLAFEDGKWVIDEVWQIGGDAWALSDLYRQGAETK